MLDELERRNYSPNTVWSYLHAVEEFAWHFGRSPEQLGPDHVREYQVHLLRDRKLSARTIARQTAALRFLFVKTLRRASLPDALPFPKHSRRLPTVLSQEEVARLIDASGNRMHRAMVMTLYATGVRRAELCRAQGLTCPKCGHATLEQMSLDSCRFFHEYVECHTLLRPQEGDCCVFCSYGSVKCPPIQSQGQCC